MKLTKWIIFGVSMLAASGLVGGMMFWRRTVDDSRKLTYAKELIDSDRASDALNVVEERLAKFGKVEGEWLEIDLQVRAELGDLERLREIYYESPQAFADREDSALLVARALINSDDFSSFETVHESWQDRTNRKAEWLILNVDSYLKRGMRDKAIHLLNSSKIDGKDDCMRLIRLAILSGDHPQVAWEFLNEAFDIDPRNAIVRSYRGQLREATADYARARIEYVAAFVAEPSNPLMCDQLAEFYRRRGDYHQMLATWREFTTEHATDFIQLKFAFWSRVTLPMDGEPVMMAMPSGGALESLVSLIQETETDRFWPTDSFERQSELPKAISARRQEVFWLKVLQAIKDDNSGDAMKFLAEMSPDKQSWNPRLERAIRQILYFRTSRSGMDPDLLLRQSTDDNDAPDKHSFFIDLDNTHAAHRTRSSGLKTPESLELVLKHRNVEALACVAAGWLMAGDKLVSIEPWPEGVPDYAPYALTQMLRVTRGPEVALKYAQLQPTSASLDLLVAEINLGLNNEQAAVKLLEELAQREDGLGHRAAGLWIILAMEKREYDVASRRLELAQSFQVSVQGQELAGRIAIFLGDDEKATACYEALSEVSLEAKVYLARRAFAIEDWDRAKALTEELIRLLPDEPQFRINLEAIDDARESEVTAS
jgi:tetratricopeptide (TPR) repeat protein